MDAFYASVEQRDDPALRGKPVAVGGGHRGVVTAASYEARPFGVRSAMPSGTAKRMPRVIFVKPRFESRECRAVSARSSRIIRTYEPLSLDWPISTCPLTSAGWGLQGRRGEIRRRIREETNLTASAGVSYCKFVAKLASDQNKPDGLCVITPERAQAYIAALPVSRFHGIGPVTARKLEALGILTGADLQERSLAELETRFGSAGRWYWRICRGLDEREVNPTGRTNRSSRTDVRRGPARSRRWRPS